MFVCERSCVAMETAEPSAQGNHPILVNTD